MRLERRDGRERQDGGAFAFATSLVVIVLIIALTSFQPLSPFQPLYAQGGERGAADAMARRVNERIRALQAEAGRLAAQARTLLGDLRQLEIQRDIETEKAAAAEAEVKRAQASLQETTQRLTALEQERVGQLPDLKLRLVDIYKRGRGGYTRMLFDVRGFREFGRAARAVAALTTINQLRIDEHRRTLESLRQQRNTLEQRTRELESAAREADRARLAAQRAVSAREALITQIDQRRDLNAQLAGELDVAYQKLQDQIANLAAGRPAESVTVPITSFRGALDWPVNGRVTAGFTAGANRQAGAAIRNGVEISAAEGSPVAAVHAGTVDYADQFSGFGNLVIVDHGGNYYSLYGYLGSISVSRGDRVDAGMELGRVGTAPAGPPALYFELRVDGRSVDPVQWLKSR